MPFPPLFPRYSRSPDEGVTTERVAKPRPQTPWSRPSPTSRSREKKREREKGRKESGLTVPTRLWSGRRRWATWHTWQRRRSGLPRAEGRATHKKNKRMDRKERKRAEASSANPAGLHIRKRKLYSGSDES